MAISIIHPPPVTTYTEWNLSRKTLPMLGSGISSVFQINKVNSIWSVAFVPCMGQVQYCRIKAASWVLVMVVWSFIACIKYELWTYLAMQLYHSFVMSFWPLLVICNDIEYRSTYMKQQNVLKMQNKYVIKVDYIPIFYLLAYLEIFLKFFKVRQNLS